MNASDDNKDLVWDLDRFKQQQQAAEFIQLFENKLCVFSQSVQQLYSNYSVFFPEDHNRKMVVLPDPHAYHDTYFNIAAAAVSPTGLNIIPGAMVGREGLHITVPVRAPDGSKKTKAVPLQKGLGLINQRFPQGRRFLPVLMKGDLREFEARMPLLHLHRIQVHLLTDRSELERGSIERTIEERLALLH